MQTRFASLLFEKADFATRPVHNHMLRQISVSYRAQYSGCELRVLGGIADCDQVGLLEGLDFQLFCQPPCGALDTLILALTETQEVQPVPPAEAVFFHDFAQNFIVSQELHLGIKIFLGDCQSRKIERRILLRTDRGIGSPRSDQDFHVRLVSGASDEVKQCCGQHHAREAKESASLPKQDHCQFA